MGVHVIKLPDVGEGVAEAEFVELHVKNGDEVQADQTLADVMTDKATVEIPAPVAGKVVWIGAEIGETIAVGTEIFKLEVSGKGNAKEVAEQTSETDQSPEENTAAKADTPPEPAPQEKEKEKPEKEQKPSPAKPGAGSAAEAATGPAGNGTVKNTQRPNGAVRQPNEKPLASPAVRKAAQDRGIDLRFVRGNGPAGRITHDDLQAYADGASAGVETHAPGYQPNTGVEQVRVMGLRRKIAQKMQDAKRRIPHASYVEEIDMTALEDLRAHMNARRTDGQPKLTLLPFLMRAIVMGIRDFPQINARYDDENDLVERYGAAHIGIATQTDNGLIVPVVRHAEANDLWTNAGEILRLSDAARTGTAKREELSGSTITITSLGAVGGIASTPVINHPEVAIIGVNKMVTRPMYNAEGQVVPRKLMNLSSSFDHRVVDGWDMAQFIQTIKAYLEYPATMFMDQ